MGRSPRGVGEWLRFLLLTGLGSGLAPFMPGTFGTLPAVAAAGGIVYAMPGAGGLYLLLALTIVLLVFGCTQTLFSEAVFGSHDPGAFVLDEVVGYFIAVLIFWVWRGPPGLWPTVLLFGLFRFFDITKLQPARRLEELPGAVGIMLDDVAAGVWAGLLAVLVAAMLSLA